MALPQDILIEKDLSALTGLIGSRRSFAIADRALKDKIQLDGIFRSIKYIETSETSKNLEVIKSLALWLLEEGADRGSLLVGIGGGITTDITGFLASVYMRGIHYALVPTTLLAQIDAAIGGKNGVNLEGFKNIIGCFGKADFIYVCPKLRESESMQSRLCGIVEMLKAFLIADGEAYAEAVELFRKDNSRIPENLVRRAVEIKCGISGRDPLEKGERRLLNLGHTFGHAIEKCSGGSVRHGEAVAAGILIAAQISFNLKLMNEECLMQLKEDFNAIGLPAGWDIPVRELNEAILADKKKLGDTLRFIIPVKPGQVVEKTLAFDELRKLTGE